MDRVSLGFEFNNRSPRINAARKPPQRICDERGSKYRRLVDEELRDRAEADLLGMTLAEYRKELNTH